MGQRGPDMDLDELLTVRVSAQAKRLVEKRAKLDGEKPSHWLRREIYKILGLIPGSKPPTGKR
jgi:hypothetical protein